MKIKKISHYINNAKAYIIDDMIIEPTGYETHLDYVRHKYELEEEIAKLFERSFGDKLEWDSPFDEQFVDEETKEFMLKNKIFCVVVDETNKQVYVRPNLGSEPNSRQMKELSDWAIENGYNEEIIVDIVVASKRNRMKKIAEKEYFTKDGDKIEFRILEDIDKRHDGEEKPYNDKRGFTVHTIEAFVNGQYAGYIKSSHIPKEKWDSIFGGNIWKFRMLSMGHYDVPEDLVESGNEDAIMRDHAKRYSYGWYGDNSSKEEKEKQKMESAKNWLESEKEKAKRQYSQWESYYLDKPIVDYIRVESDFQRKRVGYALYNKMNDWLKERFGLHFWMSSCRSDDAKKFHEKGLLDLKTHKYKGKEKKKMKGFGQEERQYMAKSDEMTKEAKSVSNKYSWVYINLPKDIQKQLLEFGKQINEEDLFKEEANNGIEDEPHVTVKYALHAEDKKDIKNVLDEAKGGDVYLDSSSIFEGEEYDVVKVTVKSKALDKLHEALNRLPHDDKYPVYQPHATIAYVKAGTGKKYDGKFKVKKSFKIAEVFFGDKKKKNHKIKLSRDWYQMYKESYGG